MRRTDSTRDGHKRPQSDGHKRPQSDGHRRTPDLVSTPPLFGACERHARGLDRVWTRLAKALENISLSLSLSLSLSCPQVAT